MEIVRHLSHPGELLSMIRMRFFTPLPVVADASPALRYCHEVLGKVSRSFAAVIMQLPEELRDAICVFYLVLRALDTVEDDTSVPAADRDALLRTLYTKLESQQALPPYGDKEEYVDLMKNFDKVSEVFNTMKPQYQAVVRDICREMGEGMAMFLVREVDTIGDWDDYCFYVAGLVGVGLSRMFAASGLEHASFEHARDISVSMGLFLQKTNIIRDYLEDVQQTRMFWPRDVWSKYARNIKDFTKPENSTLAVGCLNELVTDALRHIPHCMEYLSKLRHPAIFRFCAIPQVMAIATLAEIYNNPRVFTGVVKIRRGLACQMIFGTTNLRAVQNYFAQFVADIQRRIPSEDRNQALTRERCKTSMVATGPYRSFGISPSAVAIILILLGVSGYVAYRNREALLRRFFGIGAPPAPTGAAARAIQQRVHSRRAPPHPMAATHRR